MKLKDVKVVCKKCGRPLGTLGDVAEEITEREWKKENLEDQMKTPIGLAFLTHVHFDCMHCLETSWGTIYLKMDDDLKERAELKL